MTIFIFSNDDTHLKLEEELQEKDEQIKQLLAEGDELFTFTLFRQAYQWMRRRRRNSPPP